MSISKQYKIIRHHSACHPRTSDQNRPVAAQLNTQASPPKDSPVGLQPFTQALPARTALISTQGVTQFPTKNNPVSTPGCHPARCPQESPPTSASSLPPSPPGARLSPRQSHERTLGTYRPLHPAPLSPAQATPRSAHREAVRRQESSPRVGGAWPRCPGKGVRISPRKELPWARSRQPNPPPPKTVPLAPHLTGPRRSTPPPSRASGPRLPLRARRLLVEGAGQGPNFAA